MAAAARLLCPTGISLLLDHMLCLCMKAVAADAAPQSPPAPRQPCRGGPHSRAHDVSPPHLVKDADVAQGHQLPGGGMFCTTGTTGTTGIMQNLQPPGSCTMQFPVATGATAGQLGSNLHGQVCASVATLLDEELEAAGRLPGESLCYAPATQANSSVGAGLCCSESHVQLPRHSLCNHASCAATSPSALAGQLHVAIITGQARHNAHEQPLLHQATQGYLGCADQRLRADPPLGRPGMGV